MKRLEDRYTYKDRHRDRKTDKLRDKEKEGT